MFDVRLLRPKSSNTPTPGQQNHQQNLLGYNRSESSVRENQTISVRIDLVVLNAFDLIITTNTRDEWVC